MNLIIPMAGRGKRFADAGYNRPKPFIQVGPSPMIEGVTLNLLPPVGNHHFIYLCLSQFLNEHGDEFHSRINGIMMHTEGRCTYQVVEVKQVTEGAASTVLLAEKQIDNDEELVIANCDQLILDPCWLRGSLEYYRKKSADGGILCFLNDSPKWSYCRMSGEKVTEVVEKQVVSNIATVGVYWYRQGKMFVGAAKSMISRNFRVNGEFYVAPTFNEMICRNQLVIPYMVNEMWGLGTPEDLKIFEANHVNV